MDPASRRRVRRAATNTPRKARPHNLKESPTPPRRRTKTREPSEEVQDPNTLYALKTPGILEEDKRKNGLWYLLNWADNPKTGEAYPPSWERAENATLAAIEEWEQRKAGRAQLQNTEASTQDTRDSPDSPPIRTATRKRRADREDSLLQVGSPIKKQRLGGSSSSQPAGRIGSEIPDTYEREQSSLRDGGSASCLRVEVGVPSGFDRNAYAQAAVSQSSQIQSSELSLQSSTPVSRAAGQGRRRAFIWDEEADTEVPDSEEQVGSSAFKFLETSSASISVPAGTGSESIAEGLSNPTGLRDILSSIAGNSSASVGDSLAEPQSFLARESFRGTGTTSDRSEAGIRRTSVQQSVPTWKDSSGSQDLRLPSRQVETSTDPTFTQNPFYPSQSPSSQSSEQFLTQIIPDSSPYLGSSQLGVSNKHKTLEKSSFSSSGRSRKIRSQTKSQTPAHGLVSRQQSLPVITSSDSIRQKSKVDSLTPQGEYRSSGFQLASSHSTSNKTSSGQDLRSTEHVYEARSADHRQTSQASRASQARLPDNASGSKTSQDHSQSSHFPTPPFDDILPSIEQPSYNNHQSKQQHNTPPSSDAITNSSPLRDVSSMEPIAKPEAFDAKAAIREKMAARRAEIIQRQADRLSSSSTPMESPLLTGPSHEQAGLKVNPSDQLHGKEEDDNVDESLASIPPALLVSQGSTSLEVVPSTADEFLVPLPMVAYVRDIYNEVLRRNNKLTTDFVKDNQEEFDEEQVKEIDSMLDNLLSLCDHQDTYEEEPLTQQSEPISTRDQAKWAENCSTKCMFLAELLDTMKSHDSHILIIVRPGKMTEILQAMLEYRELNYNIANGTIPSPDPTKSALRITLHPAGSQKFLVEPPSMVIAFDSPSKNAPFLQELRLNAKRYPSGMAPLVSLVVTHTIEHLERCFNDNIGHVQGKIRLLKYLRQIGENFGHLEGPYTSPTDAAKAVAEYLDNGALAESWPLPPMPEIEEIDLSPASSEDVKDGLDIDSKLEALNMPQSNSNRPSSKRELANDLMDTDSPKRQRLTPVPGELTADMDISHVSDSVVPQSSILPLSSAIPSSSKTGAKTEAEQIALLRRQVKYLERRLETSKVSEAQHKRRSDSFERRCNDLEASIEHIQPRYQDALDERAKFERDAKDANESEKVHRKKLEKREAEVTKLEEKNATMALELAAAQETLSNSSVPDVVEIAQMRLEVSKVKAENEQLQKKLAYAEKQVDYMRSNYQNSSAFAAESASELQDLRTTNAELQKKADENTVRIHEIHRGTEIGSHLNTISRLKNNLEGLEKENEKNKEELVVAARSGRRNNTRAMSGTPASPKVTGTLSPGPFKNRPYNPTSRGGSPNPGEFFGGNLDGSSRGPPQRWNPRFQD